MIHWDSGAHSAVGPRLPTVTTGDPAHQCARDPLPAAAALEGAPWAEAFAAGGGPAGFPPQGRYEFKVHQGDAPAEGRAQRLPAPLSDVDLQASKEPHRRPLGRIPRAPY